MATISSVTRGIRNNNPGNIRKDATNWRGLAAASLQTDPAFWVFVSALWGIRALGVILRTYQVQHGLDTVRQIVNRWAPPTENDTDAYVAAVAHSIGVQPDDKVSLLAYGRMKEMIKAIITHENGCQPYDDDTIDAAVALAQQA
jgi:hypothetical protein